jgi:hypothetical protein
MLWDIKDRNEEVVCLEKGWGYIEVMALGRRIPRENVRISTVVRTLGLRSPWKNCISVALTSLSITYVTLHTGLFATSFKYPRRSAAHSFVIIHPEAKILITPQNCYDMRAVFFQRVLCILIINLMLQHILQFRPCEGVCLSVYAAYVSVSAKYWTIYVQMVKLLEHESGNTWWEIVTFCIYLASKFTIR